MIHVSGDSTFNDHALSGRMDRIQETVNSIREDIIGNIGPAQRVQRLAARLDQDTQSLSEQMAIMQRSLLRIQSRLDKLENKA